MSLLHKMAGGGGSAPTYVDDVFSAYTYTGNGSTQTITNGIDLAGQGGLVWVKSRSSVTSHYLQDSARSSFGQSILTDTTGAQFATSYITPTSTGFTTSGNTNLNTQPEVAWTFRKAPKFFDVVTYTGTGSARTISHSLGQVPGMIIVKDTSQATNWFVYHRSIGATKHLVLNQTGAEQTSSFYWNDTEPTSSVFSLGSASGVNLNGDSYVAYLFAHDTATDGLIQCGSFTTDGSGNATVTLGWEPQYVMIKKSSTTGDWGIGDASRGAAVDTNSPSLYANTSAAETNVSTTFRPNATGFSAVSGGASVTHIYLAIRRPNKPPTTGTQVYNAIARTGTGAAATVTGVGFAPDLIVPDTRATAGVGAGWYDRLRGISAGLQPCTTGAEYSDTTGLTAFGMDGVSLGTDASIGTMNVNTRTYINWFFKRAPQVFDEVCYTGNGTFGNKNHSLGVVPELIITKIRNSIQSWYVWLPATGTYGLLESTAAFAAGGGSATTTTFAPFVDTNTATYVTYLFATKAGISKIGSYTGNGTSQTINCGFSAGARFILIKKTSSTGDWFVWDTVRGIGSGFDPHLSLNTTAAEVSGTTDSIDPDNTGFIVNSQAGYDINATSATYIYLAFA